MKKLTLFTLALLSAGVLFAQDSPAYKAKLEGPEFSVWVLLFSPDGQTLASGGRDGVVRFWDIVQVLALSTDKPNAWGLVIGRPVRQVHFSPDGQTLLFGRFDEVLLWGPASGEEAGEEAIIGRHSGDVTSVQFSPDGQTVASGSRVGNASLWDLAGGKVKEFVDHDGPDDTSWWVLFSPDGQILAVYDSFICRLFEVSSGELMAKLDHRPTDNSPQFSPDGRTLASSRLEDVVLWDVESATEIAEVRGYTEVYPDHYPSSYSGADWVNSAVFSPDGRTLASASYVVFLWDVESATQTAVLDGHNGIVERVVFSPGGRTLASAGWDSTVVLWDVESATEIAVLEGHSDQVTEVSFSPDGQTLASGSRDGTILLWDMAPYVTPSTPTAIQASPSLPGQTALLGNYPNPFNSRTQLAYRLAAPGLVRLTVYNALGQPVRVLVEEVQAAGEYRVSWDGRDQHGAGVSAGVYLARLRHEDGVQTRRLLYLK